MSNEFIDIIGIMPVQMVFAYALARMLPLRNLALYWVLEIGCVLFISCARASFGIEFRIVGGIALLLIPILLSKGSLARRILVVVLANLVLFFVELPGGIMWVALTGEPIADYDAVREHFGAFLLTHAAHLALLIPLLAVLCMLLKRFDFKGRGRAAWLPVLFTSVQLTLVVTMMLLPFSHDEGSLEYYALSVSLSLLGLVADLLLFSAMDRFAQKRRDDERASMLERQLDSYLAQYAGFVDGIEHTARQRHDVGNQVQTILALSERGRFSEAREHLDLVRRKFMRFDEGERVVQ